MTNCDRAFKKRTQVIKLTTHIHPLPKLRMRGAIPLLPYIHTVHRDFNWIFLGLKVLHFLGKTCLYS